MSDNPTLTMSPADFQKLPDAPPQQAVPKASSTPTVMNPAEFVNLPDAPATPTMEAGKSPSTLDKVAALPIPGTGKTVGDVADSAKGFLVGHASNPANNIGTGKYGILTNPVTASILAASGAGAAITPETEEALGVTGEPTGELFEGQSPAGKVLDATKEAVSEGADKAAKLGKQVTNAVLNHVSQPGTVLKIPYGRAIEYYLLGKMGLSKGHLAEIASHL